MPIYEYVCEQCEQSTEAIQRLNDPPLAECPKCGGRLRKKLSAPAFQFKGSGWYATDYARKGGDSADKSSESSSSSGGDESSSSSGGDESSASPAKKADPKPEPASKPKD